METANLGSAVAYDDFLHQKKYLRNILDLLPGNAYVKNKDGIYIFTGRKYLKRLKDDHVSVNDAILGKSDFDLFPKVTADMFQRHDKIVMASKKSHYFDEELLLDNGGTQKVISKKSPCIGLNNDAIGIVGYSLTYSPILTKTSEVSLTQRELIILATIFNGMTAKEAARYLSLSYRTVEDYYVRLKYKLNCQNRSEFIELIWANQLQEPLVYFLKQVKVSVV